MLPDVLALDELEIRVESGGMSRQATLTLESDGRPRLRAAADVTIEELQSFLASKRKWIYAKLAEKEELGCIAASRELVDGESFQYLGRNYRLQIVAGNLDFVRLRGGRLQIPSKQVHVEKSPLIDWYCFTGQSWVSPRVKEWSERLRVKPQVLKVTDLGRKWGSSTAGGNVRLHWAVFQMSPVLIDYVVAHELTHLREPHHGPAFWQTLGHAMPDYAERKDRLARVGSRLWFGQIKHKPVRS